MAEYFFLTTLLPDLSLGSKPEIDFSEFATLLQNNLTPSDIRKTQVLRRYYDIQNIRSRQEGEEFEKYGNFNSLELDEAILTGTKLPGYVRSFLEKYEKETKNHFDELFQTYFDEEIQNQSGTLKKILKLKRNMRLVLAALRAKKMNRDVASNFKLENPDEPLVLDILDQKDAKQYEPPEEYQDLKVLFMEYQDRPQELHKALYNYTFEKMDSWVGTNPFSIDAILVYLEKLIMVEKWLTLDSTKGLQVIDKIVKEAV